MATMRFHIEIEVDNIDTDERMQAFTEAVQIAGRGVFTAGMFIVGDGPPPEITMWCENFDSGRTDLSLKSEDD